MNGRKHTAETRAKMSASRTGKKFTPEHRAAIGRGNKGKKRPRSEKICEVCGNVYFGVYNQKYCSRKCNKGSELRSSSPHYIYRKEFLEFKRQCAICKSKKNLVGDHDHTTGAPRGILCRFCNMALGTFRDDINVLKKAIEYLEKS